MSKPISKFSILFIFAILIPGSVLTYFSIQNISSQRDLTEKRILEEQNQLALDLSERFHEQLMACANSFFQDADSLSSSHLKAILFLDSLDFVVQAFVVGREGQFLWPNYEEDEKSIFTAEKSNAFLETYSSAEAAEFTQSDLQKAVKLYEEAYNAAGSKLERASATNATARVSAKLGFFNQAFDKYRTLVNQYGSVIDESGIPFGYYALHQLVRLSSQRSSEQFLRDIDNILTRIIRGEIPLTHYADLLVENVEAWVEALPLAKARIDVNLPDKIERIRRFLSFISLHGNAIKRFLTESQMRASLPLGRFSTIVGSLHDQPYLIVLDDNPTRSTRVGFKVNLDHLKNILLHSDQEKLQQRDLKIEILPKKEQTQTDISPLDTIKELSPYIPSWLLWIRPQNPRAITQYIVKQRWIYGIAIALLMAGMVLGVVLVLRDVSREQKLAQLRSDFVSNVTHELKTPLTSIRMFAETMRLGRIKKKSDQQEYLSIIVNESERLTRLINTVLDFSKIEQGEKQYHLEDINLSHIVARALAALEYWLKEHGFLIHTEIEPGLHIMGDGDAMEQAVLNLVSNSMKYSGDKKEITVRLVQKDDSVHLEVQDKGLGIPESKQSFIFNKYYRAHGGHQKDAGGSGLGLTVVRHIVDAHQGHIELKSRVNEGSTFTIVLPKI